MQSKHYNHPPIKEALIDIKVSYPDDFDVFILEKLHDKLKNELPIKNIQSSVNLNVSNGAVSEDRELRGYIFKNSLNSRVLQLTLDGFTLSTIGEYQSWDDFFDEFSPYWESFQEVASGGTITRISVRFINQLELPRPVSKLTDYINFAPQLEMLPHHDNIREMFSRIVVPIEENGEIMAILTHGINERALTSEMIPIILDIDVFSEVNFSVTDSGRVNSYLERFRPIKNQLFNDGLTDKTKEMFK